MLNEGNHSSLSNKLNSDHLRMDDTSLRINANNWCDSNVNNQDGNSLLDEASINLNKETSNLKLNEASENKETREVTFNGSFTFFTFIKY